MTAGVAGAAAGGTMCLASRENPEKSPPLESSLLSVPGSLPLSSSPPESPLVSPPVVPPVSPLKSPPVAPPESEEPDAPDEHRRRRSLLSGSRGWICRRICRGIGGRIGRWITAGICRWIGRRRCRWIQSRERKAAATVANRTASALPPKHRRFRCRRSRQRAFRRNTG